MLTVFSFAFLENCLQRLKFRAFLRNSFLLNNVIFIFAKNIYKCQIMMNEFLTVDEVCQMTGYKRRTLYQKTCKKQIPYVKREHCRHLLFRREEIEKWLAGKNY